MPEFPRVTTTGAFSPLGRLAMATMATMTLRDAPYGGIGPLDAPDED